MRINIKGVGASGLMTAAILSHNEIETILYDDKPFDKRVFYPVAVREEDWQEFCGMFKDYYYEEIIGLLNVEKQYTVTKISPSGERVTFSSDKPIYRIFMRGNIEGSLDISFRDYLAGKGVIIRNEPVPANPDVDASGNRLSNILGYGLVCKGTGNMDEVKLYYNNAYAKNGYVCAIPFMKDYILLLTTHFNNWSPIAEIRQKTVELLQRGFLVQQGMEITHEVIGFDNYFWPPLAHEGNTLFAGSRGGWLDSSRGFGIYYALMTGCFAAKSCMEAPSLNARPEIYDSLLTPLKERLKTEYEKRIKVFNNLTNEDYEGIVKRLMKEKPQQGYVSIARNVLSRQEQ